jgi:FMN phosphatase YigB (HAD superfamily)
MIPKNTAQGVRVGVATNQEARRALYMRTHMGFAELFHDLFISCELGAMNPSVSFLKTSLYL